MYVCMYVYTYVHVCIYARVYTHIYYREDHLPRDYDRVSHVYLRLDFAHFSPYPTILHCKQIVISLLDHGNSLLTDLSASILVLPCFLLIY